MTESSCSYNYSNSESDYNENNNEEESKFDQKGTIYSCTEEINEQTRVIPQTQDIMQELGMYHECEDDIPETSQQAQLRAKNSLVESGLVTLISILDLIELLWEKDVFLYKIIKVLKEVERQCVKERNLPWKRIIIQMQQGVLNVLKCLKVQQIEYAKCSYEVFVQFLQKDESYTMCIKKNIFPKLVDLIMDVYLKNIEEPCLSSVTMTTTTTSSTTAPTITTGADAVPSKQQNDCCVSNGDFLDELLPVSTTLSITGSISQSIVRGNSDQNGAIECARSREFQLDFSQYIQVK